MVGNMWVHLFIRDIRQVKQTAFELDFGNICASGYQCQEVFLVWLLDFEGST